jgi:hypothetical protein
MSVAARPNTDQSQRRDARARPSTKRVVRRVGEFVMIVIGVLVALGFNAWWSNRLESALAGDYRERLSAELGANLARVDQILVHTARVKAATDTLQPFFEGAGASVMADRLLINLYNATRRYGQGFVTSTFDDLTNTGNLRLIRDPGLRSDLSAVYSGLRRYDRDWFGADYRLEARKAISISLQFRVRDECPDILGDNWDGCPLAVDTEWARTAISPIRLDSDLRGAYRVQAHELAIFVRDLTRLRADIQRLLDTLGR